MCIRQRIGGSNPPLTAIFEEELVRKYGLFFSPVALPRGDEKPRPGFDNWRQPVGQMTSLRGICPEGERSESIPPLTAIFEEELVRKYGLFFSPVALPRGMRSPDRGSTTGASQLDRWRACEESARRASAASQSPPSPPYLKKSSYASTGFFFRLLHSPGGMRCPDRGYPRRSCFIKRRDAFSSISPSPATC